MTSAIAVRRFGGPEVLEPISIPIPEPTAGQVRVSVHAATVNPADILFRQGMIERDEPLPWVLGMEVAGVVDEIAPGTATELRKGDPVMAMVVPMGLHGGYARHVVVPERSVAPKPRGISMAEAATIPMNGLTARLALDSLGVRPGDWVAVTGAAGAIGGMAIQLAKASGCRVVADALPSDVALVRGLGADVVVPRGPGYAAAVRAAIPLGVHALVDAAMLTADALLAVKDGGGIASFRRHSDFDGADLRGIRLVDVGVRAYHTNREALESLGQLVEGSKLTPRVARVFPLDRAPDAHWMLEAGGVRGRLVLQFVNDV